jgi:tRNA (cmo5U34)-methyltransferase
MSHSVESHLQLKVAEYDRLIRRFIPRYDEMLDEAVRLVRDSREDEDPIRLVDLGIGTGSLTARIINGVPGAKVIGIDADPKMLQEAERRLSPNADRIELRLGDFFSALPAGQNAYIAALALHHVLDLPAKQALYQKIYDALVAGGLFVNADAMFDEFQSNRIRRDWAAHLISAGFTEEEAFSHLQSWRTEDRYFGLETELNLLRGAGFIDCDVAWRHGPMAVVTGRK